jgi:hypothetical protein
LAGIKANPFKEEVNGSGSRTDGSSSRYELTVLRHGVTLLLVRCVERSLIAVYSTAHFEEGNYGYNMVVVNDRVREQMKTKKLQKKIHSI